MIKTREEIENLKTGWLQDPIWDIESTEGFEEHKEELYNWARGIKQERKNKENQRLLDRANKLEISVSVMRCIEDLEKKIDWLENKFEKLKNSLE
jgi:hypothetical protein